jgi:hypothetical protein
MLQKWEQAPKLGKRKYKKIAIYATREKMYTHQNVKHETLNNSHKPVSTIRKVRNAPQQYHTSEGYQEKVRDAEYEYEYRYPTYLQILNPDIRHGNGKYTMRMRKEI